MLRTVRHSLTHCPSCGAELPRVDAPPPPYMTPFESVSAWYAWSAATRGPERRPTLGWLAMMTGLKRSTVQDCRRKYEETLYETPLCQATLCDGPPSPHVHRC